MDIDASEKEQVESLKKWWKDNGTSIVSGVLIGASILFGSKAWFSYQDKKQLAASDAYAQMLDAMEKNSPEQARSFANIVISKYSGTRYAPLTALGLAKIAVNEGSLEAARVQLEWAVSHAGALEIEHTSRLRLIRVLIGLQDYSSANDMLAKATDSGVYAYQYTALQGDYELAQGNKEAARTAYRQALDSMPEQAVDRAYLQAKYDNIAVVDSEV